MKIYVQISSATGRDAHGGYAELMCAPEEFVYSIPEAFSDIEAAPLLCAGAIGYRSLRLAELQDGQNLGLTGFGASAHLALKMAQAMLSTIQLSLFFRAARNEQALRLNWGRPGPASFQDQAPRALCSG